ncbi:hypothetical protein AXG93_4606s1020 [Marchantia polymorpha subsp. ruderalis]|uniref:Uncharacterized protein n=1 Tax=Marchantia polymorpha subsp. ruderalis TaxID=1480154 RepID=A0A176VDI2_MARPO|nr:hypothetical protein AXG93_4606s1020 [Marchantia polymorpha subsp. ruderalis]
MITAEDVSERRVMRRSRPSLEERSRSLEKTDIPEPKTSEEHAKKLTLSEEILEQIVEQTEGTVVESSKILSAHVSLGTEKSEDKKRSSTEEPKEVLVAFVNFFRESVVPLLKYLDGKQEKYTVLEEAGFYVEMLRNRTRSKRAASMKTAEDVERVAGKSAAATAGLGEGNELQSSLTEPSQGEGAS